MMMIWSREAEVIGSAKLKTIVFLCSMKASNVNVLKLLFDGKGLLSRD